MSTENRIKALQQHLGLTDDQVEDGTIEGDNPYNVDGEEYLVLTDDEADSAFRESVESYIDDCILHEIPKAYRPYFDADSFIRDVELSDGRGHTLASYDGEENEEKVDGEWFYIYRVS
jgi:hypothetical protein